MEIGIVAYDEKNFKDKCRAVGVSAQDAYLIYSMDDFKFMLEENPHETVGVSFALDYRKTEINSTQQTQWVKSKVLSHNKGVKSSD